MNALRNKFLSTGGLAACCAATVQISQLVDGRAAPELWNYAMTALTAAVGVGLFGSTWWPQSPTPRPDDHRALVASLDRLFAHFSDDKAAQEAVRAVARAITERRYRSQHSEQ